MIKKLKRKFIYICMASVLIVFATIIITVNIINYRNVEKDIDQILTILSNGDGRFPVIPKRDPKDPNSHFTEETPYETRYFSLKINSDKQIIEINMQNIKIVTEEEAINYSLELYDEEDGYGKFENYRYIIKTIPEGKLFIYVDCNRQLYLARNFMKTTIFVGVVAMIGIFALVCIFSMKAIEPIAKSYDKQRKFITDAGHELKTPLTIISANTELIEMESGENENTIVIKKQINRLTSMTNNLVLLSKIDENSINEEKNEFNLSDSAIDVIENFKKIAEKNQKEIKTQIQDNLLYLGNEKLLRQLFYILFDNAIKYSKSYIDFSMEKQKNKISICITNDTNGIEKGSLDNYCDRFFRTSDSRASSIEGSGIGLSIAKEIVLMHKGEIKVYSNDGIIFTIKIFI